MATLATIVVGGTVAVLASVLGGVDELNRGGEIWGQKMMSSIYLKITGI